MMKPQDSKKTTQSSLQPQEGESAAESLESLLARLEQLNTEPEEKPPLHGDKLKGIIADLERDIVSGHWFNAYYADIDLRMMPALVEQANRKYPNMNLKLATTPEELTPLIKETIANGTPSSRYLVNTGTSRIHFATLDHRTIDHKISLMMFEPTTSNNIVAARLELRVRQAIEDCQLPNCYFSTAEMDIQRSSSECGIFGLVLAKKLHLESDKLTRMHKDHVNGALCEPYTPLSPEKLDSYLPESFYKHTQSKKRLGEYIQRNPRAEHEKVNKKNETLTDRFEKNSVTKEEKAVSVSPHRKRISEYKSVLTL